MKKKKFLFLIDAQTEQKLAHLAHNQDRSKAAVIRELIRHAHSLPPQTQAASG